LVIALNCLKKLSSRREVIVPAYTCPLVALAVEQAGLELKLCDLKPNSYDLDPTILSNLACARTLCVIPTHLSGLPSNLAETLSFARQAGAYVIEDAAQALGAVWNGRPVGTVGDIGVFSLTCGKGLTVGEGGVLVAPDPDLRAKLLETSRELVRADLYKELSQIALLLGYTFFYRPFALRFLYGQPLRRSLEKGDLVQAVGDRFALPIALTSVGKWRKQVAAGALNRLKSAIESNTDRGRKRAALLNQIAGVTALTESEGSSGTWPFISLLFASEAMRDRVLSSLWTSGLGVTRLFIHDLTGYDYLKGIVPATAVPNATSFAQRSLTISNSSFVSDQDFETIKAVISASTAQGSRNLEREEILLRAKTIS
jgi:dTDP-4-amino-4,6-dideoxygalactose transaminase